MSNSDVPTHTHTHTHMPWREPKTLWKCHRNLTKTRQDKDNRLHTRNPLYWALLANRRSQPQITAANTKSPYPNLIREHALLN